MASGMKMKTEFSSLGWKACLGLLPCEWSHHGRPLMPSLWPVEGRQGVRVHPQSKLLNSDGP